MKRFIALILSFVVMIFTSVSAFAAQEQTGILKCTSPTTITLEQGQPYDITFGTASPGWGRPIFSVGSDSVLQGSLVSISSNYYTYQIVAVGKVGQTTSVYSRMPGQKAIKQVDVKIVSKSSNKKIPNKIWLNFEDGFQNSNQTITQWYDSPVPVVLWGYSGFDNVQVSIKNSNTKLLQVYSCNEPYDVLPDSFQGIAAGKLERDEIAAARKQGYFFEDPEYLASNSSFLVSADEPGTATLTYTIKSKSGATRTLTQTWIFKDPSTVSIQSDTPSVFPMKSGQSYTFKIAVDDYMEQATFETSVFTNESSNDGEDQDSSYSINKRASIKAINKGDGVYLVTVTAALEGGGKLAVGDLISLKCIFLGTGENVRSVVVSSIIIV